MTRHARSWLFVPASRAHLFTKATASGADAVILDLEDSVASPDKAAARANVVAWLASGHAAWVRINGRESEFWLDDVRAIRAGGFDAPGLVLPMTDDPAQVADTVDASGAEAVVVLIETAKGIETAGTIAAAPKVVHLALGVADLQLDVGLGDDPAAWSYPRSKLVFASRASGIAAPLDGPSMQLDRPDEVRKDANAARAHGFAGKLCIHPGQVGPVNDAFGYTERQRDWARQVLAGAQDSAGAAVRVAGEMIDRPRLDLAHDILAHDLDD